MDIESIIQTIDEVSAPHPPTHVVLTGGEPMICPELPELCFRLKDRGMHITIETAGTVLPWKLKKSERIETGPSTNFTDVDPMPIHSEHPVVEAHDSGRNASKEEFPIVVRSEDRPIVCDLMSISPKLSNSTPTQDIAGTWHEKHQQSRFRPEVVRKLIEVAEDYQLKFVVASVLDAEEVLEYLNVLETYRKDRVLLMPRGITSEELHFHSEWLSAWCLQHGVRYCDRSHIHWFGNRRGT